MKNLAGCVTLACLLVSVSANAQERAPAPAPRSQGITVRAGGGATMAVVDDGGRAGELVGMTPAIGVGGVWPHLRVLADASATIGSTESSDIVLAKLGPSFEGYSGRVFGGAGLRFDYLHTARTSRSQTALGAGAAVYAGVDVLRFAEKSSVFLLGSVAIDSLREMRSSDFEIKIFGGRSEPATPTVTSASVLAGYRFD